MKSKVLSSIVATVMSCCFVFTGITNTTNASGQSEKALVEQTINNFYTSIENKDSLLFLKSIADSDQAAYQAQAKSLEGTKTNYDIVEIKKTQESKYEVYIANLSSPDGKELPVIPYDVVLVDGQWKLDRSTVGIFPKEELKKITDSGYEVLSDSAFFNTVVSENENFYIRKDSQKSDGIALRDWRTYNFGTQSADIYSPGVLGVTSMPGTNTGPNNSTNWVIAICKDAYTGLESSKSLHGFNEDSYNFEVDGYHNINVFNFNYPDQPGKYNVVW